MKLILYMSWLASALAFSNSVMAQWFYFDPVRVEAGIRFDGSTSDFTQFTPSESTTAQEYYQLEERLLLGLGGNFVDPRIFKFTFDIEPVFRQGRQQLNDKKDSARGDDLDYRLDMGVLQGSNSPVSADLLFSRFTNTNDLAFGSFSTSDISLNSVGINWGNKLYPLILNYSTGTRKQEFIRADGFTNLRDEDRQRILLTGRSTKLRLRLSSEKVEDNVGNSDFQTDSASIDHLFQWGRGSSISSALSYFDRRGIASNRIIRWNQAVGIHHTDDLTSRASYRYLMQEATDKNETLEGSYRLRHELYGNLRSDVYLNARNSTSTSFSRDEYGAGASSLYRKSFFFGSISFGVRGEYKEYVRDSQAGRAEVIDEVHRADLLIPFLLEERLVEQETIVVTADDGFSYSEGVDYEIAEFAQLFTQIRIIPTGRITQGELLLVSYSYLLLPAAEYTSVLGGFDFSYSYRWLSLRFNQTKLNFRKISGFGIPADDENRVATLQLSHDFNNFSALFSAEARFRKIGGLKSDDLILRESVTVPISYQLDLTISASQLFHESTGEIYPNPFSADTAATPGGTVDLYSLDAGLSWRPLPQLNIRPFLGAWKRDEARTDFTEETAFDQTYVTLGLRASWVIRKLTLNFNYVYNSTDYDSFPEIRSSRSAIHRVYFSARRFFR